MHALWVPFFFTLPLLGTQVVVRAPLRGEKVGIRVGMALGPRSLSQDSNSSLHRPPRPPCVPFQGLGLS